ncbi:MAG: hypothetical protein GY810_01240 [Aureispira sp.]|nr:hypothetical protein [Aureispira sp.]
MWTEIQVNKLERSIKHHKAFKADPDNVELGSDTCPCCWSWISYSCAGCPISQYTGTLFCQETPFDELILAIEELEVAKHSANVNQELITELKNSVQDASQAEIGFLEEVLEYGRENK